jgi:hypothetical protein
VPDTDRATGLGDRPRMAGADLSPREPGGTHCLRPGESGVRQQQGFACDLNRLLHRVLGRVRDVADETQSLTGADHLGAE